MQTRIIRGTDLTVSALAFGNFPFGTNWWGEYTDDEAIAIQNHAVDRGVTFFDTAPTYGNGRSESLLAETIKYAGRDQLFVSTKFGYDIVTDPGDEQAQREKVQNFTPRNLRQELETSLERMGIDCIDLYQAHNIKLPHYTDELFECLERLKDEGKIRGWGVALGPAIGWREEGYDALIARGADTVQTVMNLYEQDPGRELCQIADHLGAGSVIARVPTNSGILDEEFDSPDHQFPPNDHRKFRDRDWLVYGLEKNKIIEPMAQELGLTVREFAVQWLLGFDAMCSVEPNLLSKADVDAYVKAVDAAPLPYDVLAKLAELYADDFGLGDNAHPCDWKSSVTEDGKIRSAYQRPEIDNWQTPVPVG